MKKDDMIGKKFNRLTVIEKIGIKKRKSIYKCLCDCGNYTEVYRSDLISNNTKGCGCLRIEHGKNLFENTKKQFIKEGTNLNLIVNRKKEVNKNNKSGIKGLYQKTNKKWVAQLTFKSKKYYLGTYNTKEDAIKAYNEAVKKRDEYLKNKGLL